MASSRYDVSSLAVVVGRMNSLSSTATDNTKQMRVTHDTYEMQDETGEFGLKWPKELLFLKSPCCNPDFADSAMRKRGDARRIFLLDKEEVKTKKHSRIVDALLLVTEMVVSSWTFQSVVMAIIFFDFVVTIYVLAEADSKSVVFDVADYLVLIVLTLDVFARFFVKGCIFLRGYLNIFELFLVPVAFVEVFLLANMNIPVQMLRVLRPIFRGFRLMRILVRTASKTESYLLHLRHQVSGDRLRFMQDGFDLDLAYITNQITVMSCPAVGRESWLHNPAKEVAQFYNERHTNSYLILNTLEKRPYPLAPFFDRYMEFSVLKDGVPNLDALLELCRILDTWLQIDPKHHLAVHSMHGQGRASMIVMALLIYSGVVRTPASAVRFFEQNRSHPDSQAVVGVQCCDCASQVRFLEYFARRCHERRLGQSQMPSREARLVSIEVCGLPHAQTLDVACFGHAALKESSNGVSMKEQDEFPDDFKEHFQAIKSLVDQCTYDSLTAGGMPAATDPLFSSVSTPEVIKSKSLGHSANGLAPAVWKLEPITICGELKIEISRRKLSAGDMEELNDTGAYTATGSQRRNLRGKKDPGFDHGLMLCCWLHTDFLEQDEEKSNNRRGQQQKRIIVSIDRFSLDKAANAPGLKSHPESLALKLTFEVDERQELYPLGEVSKQKQQGATSRLEMSQPEATEWLTFVGNKVWPNFEMGFRKLLEDHLISVLQESLPSPLNEKVELRSFSLGSKVPKLGPVLALSKHHDRGKQVQLNLDLDYTTDTDVVIDFGIAAVGITQLSIKGTLCFKFKPLLTEIPVLCAMQLFFLNSPTIHINFGNALAVANFSMAQDALYGAIHDALCDMLVLPNVMNVNWGDPEATSDTAVTFVNELPCSVLRVGIRGARNLKAATSYLWRPPDTVVKVSVGENHAQGKAVPQTTDPIFDETFDLVVYDEYQHVMCGVYDEGITGSHDLIGAFAPGTSVTEIASVSKEGAWIDLVGTPENIISQIHVTAEIFELRNDAEQLRHLWAKHSQSGDSPKMMPLGSLFSMSPNLSCAKESDVSGSCMLLVCQVLGGKIQPEMAADAIAVQVKLGCANGSQNCAPYSEPTATVNEKLKAAIHKLHDLNYGVEAIADILQESPDDIKFALRSKQFNMMCSQKICVLAKPHELASASDVEFAIVERTNGTKRCMGKLSVQSILAYDDACKKGHVACKDPKGQILADLDVDIRFFSLQAVERVMAAERHSAAETNDDVLQSMSI